MHPMLWANKNSGRSERAYCNREVTLKVHVLDAQASEALPAAVPIALKIDQVHQEAIKGIVHRDLEESILTLCEAVEETDLALVVRQRVVENLRVMRVHGFVFRVGHELANEFDFGGEDKLTFVEGFEDLQVKTMIVDIKNGELHLFAHCNLLLGLELMVLEAC
eukprot:CAMPEP_0170456466 /NCGR_PEP_ID=MMETSP0123-20130129/4089_1 /TAXON_ID=182087 /ORGANISM="Favella ehrenbergii, Strain Fehren 1" /LENGTH=163 /DNA_ID=CAMNT_0010719949 /DNA_START=657 /DNA_END=1147 /DNA_ORIENTATION=+